MVLNEAKSFYQFFCSKKSPQPPQSTPYGTSTDTLKVLGCYLTPSQEAQSLKAKLAMAETSLNRLSFARVSPALKRRFYIAVVESQIRYSAVALNGGELNNKRLLQQIVTKVKRACCRVTSAFRCCSPERAFTVAACQHPRDLLQQSYYAAVASMSDILLWKELTRRSVPRRTHTEHLKPLSRRHSETNALLSEGPLQNMAPAPRPPSHWNCAAPLAPSRFPAKAATSLATTFPA